MVIHTKAGTRTHQLIAAGVRAEVTDVRGLARQLWRLDPVGGTIQSSVRGACVSKAGMYLRRFRPGPDWLLIGAEFDLGGARADLVWKHGETGEVFVDEVKVGAPGIDDPETRDQIERLAGGGRRRWGRRFRGVRLVELRAPRRSGTWDVIDGRLLQVGGADPGSWS